MNKKFIIFIIFFMVSLPLIAEVPNTILTGQIPPNVNFSISPSISPDLQNLLLNRLLQEPSAYPCDTLNDTTLGCDWSNIPWSSYIIDYDTLPEYPNCPIMVVYKVKICPNNPLIRQIYIVNILIDLSDYTNCKSLHDFLYTGSEEEQATKLQQIKEELYFSLSQREAEQMADLPPCDSLGNYFPQTVFYKQPVCKSSITIHYTYPPDSMLPNPPPIYEEIACNPQEGCCKTTISFCQDSLGNVNPQISKEILGTTCIGYPIEFDYEDLLRFYGEQFIGAYVSFELTPCTNACN